MRLDVVTEAGRCGGAGGRGYLAVPGLLGSDAQNCMGGSLKESVTRSDLIWKHHLASKPTTMHVAQ